MRTGAVEMRNSLFKRGYLGAVRRYCPDLQLADLLPEEAGIRAQAVLRDGTLVHDFLFTQSNRTLHVINAPSPAATSAIPIGDMIARLLPRRPPLRINIAAEVPPAEAFLMWNEQRAQVCPSLRLTPIPQTSPTASRKRSAEAFSPMRAVVPSTPPTPGITVFSRRLSSSPSMSTTCWRSLP